VDSPADVEEPRALGEQAAPVGDGGRGVGQEAAVEKESGVTFTTPITTGSMGGAGITCRL
jgi:hypothetical protein